MGRRGQGKRPLVFEPKGKKGRDHYSEGKALEKG